MTDEFLLPNQTLIDSRPITIHDTGAPQPASWPIIAPHPCLPNPRRKVLHHCCSRLTASGLPGADIAVEYIHGIF